MAKARTTMAGGDKERRRIDRKFNHGNENEITNKQTNKQWSHGRIKDKISELIKTLETESFVYKSISTAGS